jgi:site-specific recombinase XerD
MIYPSNAAEREWANADLNLGRSAPLPPEYDSFHPHTLRAHQRTMSTADQLKSIAPSEAKELYLDSRRSEVSESTLRAHHYRLGHFVRFCEQEGIEDMTDLHGRALHEYRVWRRDEGGLNRVTLQTQLSTLRTFLRFCETIDGVRDGLSEKIVLPTLKDGEGERTSVLSNERATEIREYLSTFEYASRDHALLELCWHTGMRIGEVHALDVGDYHSRKQTMEVCHRPQGGTCLKNGRSGERVVALSDGVCDVLDDYLDITRPNVEDDRGRRPLFTSQHGRPSKTTLRAAVYRFTQPCLVGECPIGRNPDECSAVGYTDEKCPENLSPHDTRRGAITHFLSNDVPEKAVSDRMDVSSDVLDKHYDVRSEEQKAEQRRGFLANVD